MRSNDSNHGRTAPTPSHIEWLQIVALILSLLSLSALVTIVASRIRQYYPDNHWSLDIRWLCCVSVFGFVVSMISIYKASMVKTAVTTIVTCGLLRLLILVLDQFNLLVEYSVWIRRGMPGPFE